MLLQYIALRLGNRSEASTHEGTLGMTSFSPQDPPEQWRLSKYSASLELLGCGKDGRLCDVECDSKVFGIDISSAGLSMVGYGEGGMTAADVWVEPQVALSPILPLSWQDSGNQAGASSGGSRAGTTTSTSQAGSESTSSVLGSVSTGTLPPHTAPPVFPSMSGLPAAAISATATVRNWTSTSSLRAIPSSDRSPPPPASSKEATGGEARTTKTVSSAEFDAKATGEDGPPSMELVQSAASASQELRQNNGELQTSGESALKEAAALSGAGSTVARHVQMAVSTVDAREALSAAGAGSAANAMALLSPHVATVGAAQTALKNLVEFAEDQERLDLQVSRALLSSGGAPASDGGGGSREELLRAAEGIVGKQQESALQLGGMMQTTAALLQSMESDTEELLDILLGAAEALQKTGGDGAEATQDDLKVAIDAVKDLSSSLQAVISHTSDVRSLLGRREASLADMLAALAGLAAEEDRRGGDAPGRRLQQAVPSGSNNGVMAAVTALEVELSRQGQSTDATRERAIKASLQQRLSSHFLTLHLRMHLGSGGSSDGSGGSWDVPTSQQADPQVLGSPPQTPLLSASQHSKAAGETSFRCPSAAVPECWLDPRQGTVVKEPPPDGCATCRALSGTFWRFDVSPTLTFMQPLGGSGASQEDAGCICSPDGQPALGVLVASGAAGEHTVAFRGSSSGVPCVPVSFYVQGRVASIAVDNAGASTKAMPSSVQSAGQVSFPSATLEPAGQQVTLRFKDSNGLPVAGAQAVAVPVDESGQPLPDNAAIDVGKPLTATAADTVPVYQGVLPMAFTTASDKDGVATFEPAVLRGTPQRCFHLAFYLLPCGADGEACPAARAAGVNTATSAVKSGVTFQKFCIVSEFSGYASMISMPPSSAELGGLVSPSPVPPLKVRIDRRRSTGSASSQPSSAVVVGVGAVPAAATAAASVLDAASFVLENHMCWYVGDEPITAGCSPLEAENIGIAGNGLQDGNGSGDAHHNNLVVATFDELTWAAGRPGTSLSFVLWPPLPPTSVGGAATRPIAAEFEVAAELLEPLPLLVASDGILKVSLKVVAPSGARVRHRRVEVSLVHEKEASVGVLLARGVDLRAAAARWPSAIPTILGGTATTNAQGEAAVAAQAVGASAGRYRLMVKVTGGQPQDLGGIDVQGALDSVIPIAWHDRDGAPASTLSMMAPSKSSGGAPVAGVPLPVLQVQVVGRNRAKVERIHAVRVELYEASQARSGPKELPSALLQAAWSTVTAANPAFNSILQSTGLLQHSSKVEVAVTAWDLTPDGVLLVRTELHASVAGRFKVQVVVEGMASDPDSSGLALELQATELGEAIEASGPATSAGISLGLGVLLMALAGFSFPGNSPAKHPLWNLLGVVTSAAALGVCWAAAGTMPSGWAWTVAALPGLAFCCHGGILIEWIAICSRLLKKDAVLSWDFEGFRNRCVLNYTKSLIYERVGAGGSTSNSGSNWALALSAAMRGRTAFFFPQRLLAAAAGSCVVVVAGAVALWCTAPAATSSLAVAAAAPASLGVMYIAAQAIPEGSMHSAEASGAPEALVRRSAAAAMAAETLVDAAVGSLCFWGTAMAVVACWQWVAALARFRRQCLAARLGRGPLASSSIASLYPQANKGVAGRWWVVPPAACVSGFMGAAAARSVLGWIVATLWAAVLSLPLLWSASRGWLASLGLRLLLPALAALLVAWSIPVVAILALQQRTRGAGALVDTVFQEAITNRRAWTSVEVVELCLLPFTALFRGLLHTGMASASALGGFVTVDAGGEGGSLFPVAGGVFLTLGRLHHSQTDPSALVAAWLFTRGGRAWAVRRAATRARKSSKKGSGRPGRESSGRLSRAAQRVRMRFRVALVLHRNPELRRHRAHALAT